MIKEVLDNFSKFNIFNKLVSGGSEINVKCIKCETERLKNKGHLYISTSSWLCYCHKCNFSGTINDIFEFYKIPFRIDIEYRKNYCDSRNIIRKSYRIPDYDNYINSRGYRYILNRINFIPENVIFNFSDFLKINNIKKDNNFFNKYDVDFFNNETVGFLGELGKIINFRLIEDEKSNKNNKHRYYTVILNDDVYTDFYVYKVSDISYKSFLNVFYCEGVFKIYENRDIIENEKIDICFSSFGKSRFLKSLIEFINYYKLYYFNLYILLDPDVTEKDYLNVLKKYNCNFDIKFVKSKY